MEKKKERKKSGPQLLVKPGKTVDTSDNNFIW